MDKGKQGKHRKKTIYTGITQDKTVLNRREILQKYGAYTAPLVVSMLLPEQAYAMNGMTPYSSISTCQANHSGMQATNMHCANRHPIG